MKVEPLKTLLARSLWLAAALIACCASGAGTVKQGPLFGKPAPAFQVQGIYNETCSLEAFKGHILVMQFGASW